MRQMRTRHVGPAEVEAVLANPEEEYPGEGQSIIYVATVGGRRIKIYWVMAGQDFLVITVAVRGE
jgi:hypothetical protein